MLEILRGLKPSFETTCVYTFGFAPFLALIYFGLREQKRRAKIESPPQDEKLLRPAGHSCYARMEEAESMTLRNILLSAFLSAMCGANAAFTFKLLLFPSVRIWSVIPLITGCAFAYLTANRFKHTLKGLEDLRNYRLGLRGEQAVAEVLHQLGEYGYRAYHDFPAAKDWNIDHIVIGTRGVYVIETKARMRRGSRNGQPEHVVLVKGDMLEFPTARNFKAIPQALRNAEWLCEYLSKRSPEPVKVHPILVIPGWFVDPPGKTESGVFVTNANYLTGHLKDQPKSIPPSSVQALAALVEDKCRDVEF